MSLFCSIGKQCRLALLLFFRGQCWNGFGNCFIHSLPDKTLEWTSSSIVVGANVELTDEVLGGTLSHNHLPKRNNFYSFDCFALWFQSRKSVHCICHNLWSITNSSISILPTNLFIRLRFRKGGYAAKQKISGDFYEWGERIARASVVKIQALGSDCLG